MARNRQRAKQRQADRRAARMAEQGGAPPPEDAPPRGDEPDAPAPDPTVVEPSPAVPPELAVGAPPQNEGRSDTVIHDEPVLDDAPPRSEEEAYQEIEDWEVEDHDGPDGEPVPVGAGESGYEAKGRRGREDAERHKDRPRVIQFLIASWAELQRVQWPNRQALTTLTGVVLGFVLIAGGYLGLLDAIFSELIKAII